MGSFADRDRRYELLAENARIAEIHQQRHARAIKRREAAAESKRASLAEKIVMVLTDRIVADIVRPGPKPEERECYVMAQELRDIGAELQTLVSQVLRVDAALSPKDHSDAS